MSWLNWRGDAASACGWMTKILQRKRQGSRICFFTKSLSLVNFYILHFSPELRKPTTASPALRLNPSSSVGRGRRASMLFEHSAQVVAVGETAIFGDLLDGMVGVSKLPTGLVESEVQKNSHWSHAEFL